MAGNKEMPNNESYSNRQESNAIAGVSPELNSIMDRLQLDKKQLAEMLGLPLESFQGHLEEVARNRLNWVVQIFDYIEPWAGSTDQAFAWYRATHIPSLGSTAEELVKSGHAEAVISNLERIAVGGYA